MAQWLVKEEPDHYGYDKLEKDGKTVWAGVRNPPGKEPASQGARRCRECYGDFAVVGRLRDGGQQRCGERAGLLTG